MTTALIIIGSMLTCTVLFFFALGWCIHVTGGPDANCDSTKHYDFDDQDHAP